MNLEQALAQIVRMERAETEVRVHFRPPALSSLLFKLYGSTLEACAQVMFRRAQRDGAQRSGPHCITFTEEQAAGAFDLVSALRHRIGAIAVRPIYQSRAEAVLRISRKECNRWTKDGRLPTSGSVTLSRAANLKIRRSQYSPRVIADLADHPERLERWRAQDRGALHAHGSCDAQS